MPFPFDENEINYNCAPGTSPVSIYSDIFFFVFFALKPPFVSSQKGLIFKKKFNIRKPFLSPPHSIVVNPSPAVCKAFANSFEPDQTQSNLASGQVPSCLPLCQYVFPNFEQIDITLM